MPSVQLSHVSEFCAAYRLRREDWDEERNRRTYGACANRHGHGHDFALTVTVEGEPDAESGLLMDFVELGEIVHDRVVRHLDHRNLNLDVDFLAGIVPTAENLLPVLWERLAPFLPPGVRLRELRLQESRAHAAAYRGEGR